MLKKRFSPEQIIATLRQIQVHPDQRRSIALACKEAANPEPSLSDQRLIWNSSIIGGFPSVTKVPSYRPACVWATHSTVVPLLVGSPKRQKPIAGSSFASSALESFAVSARKIRSMAWTTLSEPCSTRRERSPAKDRMVFWVVNQYPLTPVL